MQNLRISRIKPHNFESSRRCCGHVYIDSWYEQRPIWKQQSVLSHCNRQQSHPNLFSSHCHPSTDIYMTSPNIPFSSYPTNSLNRIEEESLPSMALNRIEESLPSMATSQAMTIATGSASEIEEVKGRWRTDEDEKLIRAVNEHGAKNWSVICTQIPGRSAKSCRLRWQNQLSPDVNHSPFTLEEDLEIVRHQSRLGNKWAAIARVLNAGRTENAVKNHWNCQLRNMKSSYSPVYDRCCAYHRYGYRYHPRPPASNGSDLVLSSLSQPVISEESSQQFFPSNGGGEPHGSIDLTLRLAPPGPGLRSSSLPSTREMVSFAEDVDKNEARGHLVELRGDQTDCSNHASESVMNPMENQAGVGRRMN